MEFYNYPPKNHLSPFEAKDADNYFAEAGKITYLGTFEEIGNIATPFDERNNIFTGAYVLCIYKRYAIIENGVITYRNQNFNDGHEIGASRYKTKNFIIYTNVLHEYKIDSWKTSSLKTYTIQDTCGTYDCSLCPRLFKNPGSAIQYAVDISKNQSMQCIVAQWFADIDRH